MAKFTVGEMVVLKGHDALKLSNGQDSPEANGFCNVLVVGRDWQGRPIIELWGKLVTIDPDLIVDADPPPGVR